MLSRSAAVIQPGERPRASRRFRRLAAGLAFSLLLMGASPSAADEFDSRYAGHPLRFAAYLVYPIGVILETLITRPAHWLIHRPALKGLFGHTD